jgi:hypothetical protein
MQPRQKAGSLFGKSLPLRAHPSKGVRDGDTFTEVPEDEIIKGYEHNKGHHVLIHPTELDDLKLEAKHTNSRARRSAGESWFQS